MAAAVPVTFNDFLKVEAELKKLGFGEIYHREAKIIAKAYGLKPPREYRRGEVGFKYSAHGYTVKVWTTCIRDAVEKCRRAPLEEVGNVIVGHPAGDDMGWVVVVDGVGRAQYFARPTLRTKNFVVNLLRRTWITWWKIQNRPLCRVCGKFMQICSNQHGGIYWGCYRRKLHPNQQGITEDWDRLLPPKALKFAQAWRNDFQRYLRAEKKKGKTPVRAATVRKPWVATSQPFDFIRG